MNDDHEKDDFFGSDDEEATPSRDWNKMQDNAKNIGLKEGLESSQDIVLQSGFNRGFKEALHMSFQAGEIQGTACALMTRKPSADSHTRLEASTDYTNKFQEIIDSDSTLIASIPSLLKDNIKRLNLQVQNSPNSSLELTRDTLPVLDEDQKPFWEKVKSLRLQIKEVENSESS